MADPDKPKNNVLDFSGPLRDFVNNLGGEAVWFKGKGGALIEAHGEGGIVIVQGKRLRLLNEPVIVEQSAGPTGLSLRCNLEKRDIELDPGQDTVEFARSLAKKGRLTYVVHRFLDCYQIIA